MAVLIGMSGLIKGQKYEITTSDTSIGRSTANDIRIDDSSVSSNHCHLLKDEGRYTLIDIGSTNGTRANGARIEKIRLKPKDILQVGNVELLFDGQDVEIEEESPRAVPSQVEVIAGPAEIPNTFHTSSPFGTRKDNRLLWMALTGVLGLLVVGALVFFILRLFGG